jgi:tRNA A-37 threonylcarbamoyl transferase component Bud32
VAADREAAPVAEPERIVSRARVYGVLSLGTLGATLAILFFARPPTQPTPAIASLIAQTLLLLVAASTMRTKQTTLPLVARGVLLSMVALLAGASAWFWGPNGPFAAFIVLVLLFAGVLSEPGPRGRIGASVYVALAIGQALPVALVLTDVIDDRSIVPLLLPGHPAWHHAAGHAAIQAVYLAAYLAGRGLQRRYAEVSATMEASMRATSLRDALLEEARAEYRRAVASSRTRNDVAPVTRASQPPPRTEGDTEIAPRRPSVPPDADAPPTPTPTPSSVDPITPTPLRASPSFDTTDAWRAAYQSRTRLEQGLLFSMGIIGAALLGVVGPGPVPVAVGCTGILLITVLVSFAREHERARAGAWVLVGALSVLPAYTVGLHSGFACVVACVLFFGSAFDTSDDARTPIERWLRTYGTVVACVVTHLAVFVLVVSGVVADAGNAPILAEGHTPAEPYAMHACVQLLYVGSFALGHLIDRRYRALVVASRAAAKETARREAQLRAATADVHRAIAANEALFNGETVGRYRMEKLLASGGMGEVYEASVIDRRGERVAVKLLRRDRTTDALSIRLFEEEAAVIGRVQSPYVARLLEVSPEDADLPYIVMELIDGSTLAAILRARRRLSPEEVRALVRDVAEGLRAVHAAGIIHRDLKPHNVMLTTSHADGARWKIVDFGVAQLHDVVSAGAAIMVGTPSYMAPEQALGERVDARADLYALGLVAYRALAGRPAFVGDDAVAIAAAARAAGPPDPRSWTSMSRDVERALRLALAARPEDRYATATEMKRAFDAAFAEKLDEKLRTRADRLIDREPWSAPHGTSPELDVPTKRAETPTKITTPGPR